MEGESNYKNININDIQEDKKIEILCGTPREANIDVSQVDLLKECVSDVNFSKTPVRYNDTDITITIKPAEHYLDLNSGRIIMKEIKNPVIYSWSAGVPMVSYTIPQIKGDIIVEVDGCGTPEEEELTVTADSCIDFQIDGSSTIPDTLTYGTTHLITMKPGPKGKVRYKNVGAGYIKMGDSILYEWEDYVDEVSYIIDFVTDDVEIVADCGEKIMYKVHYNLGSCSTINNNTAEVWIYDPYNAAISEVWGPTMIDTVRVTMDNYGTVTTGTTININEVIGDIYITTTCKARPTPQINKSFSSGCVSYNGPSSVTWGSSASITLTPASGYSTVGAGSISGSYSSITVNGSSTNSWSESSSVSI